MKKIKKLLLVFLLVVMQIQSGLAINNKKNSQDSTSLINKTTENPINLNTSPTIFRIAAHKNDINVVNIICSLVNANTKYNLTCQTVEISNPDKILEGFQKGDFSMAFMESFVVKDLNKDNNRKNLQFLFNTDMKVPFILVKRENVSINLIKDLKDKIIDVGQYHSNNEYIANLIKKLSETDEAHYQYSSEENREVMLCKNQVDASFIYGSISNDLVKNITDSCEVKIMSIPDKVINKLSETGVFSKQKIPGDYYLSNPKDTNVFGSPMILLANKDTNKNTVKNFVTIIFDNLDVLQKVSSNFSMSKKDMIKNNILLETHEGAKIYYKQNNLML